MIITAIGDEIGTTLEDQIEALKEVNMKYIEIRKINDIYIWKYSEEQIKKIKKEFEKNEIKVITIDTPIGKKNNSFNYDENIKLLDKYIKIANIFEAKYLRIFSDVGRKFNSKSIKEVIREMANITTKNKLNLLIENEKDTYAEDISTCNELIDNEKNVYILYDIENVYSRGYDVLNEYEKNKNNIKYIHIRDYNKKTQEYVYFGEGTIPITKLLKSLNKDKYDGVISLETMLPKYNKKESKKDIFVKSYKSLINICNKEE